MMQTMTSDVIFEELKQRVQDRNHARTALHEIRALPECTEEMRENAHAAYAQCIRDVAALQVRFDEAVDAEVVTEPNVTISASDLRMLVEAANSQIRHGESLESKHGVSWALRTARNELRSTIERVTTRDASAGVLAV